MSTGKEMNRTTQEVWMMMNENVVKILKAYMWDVATCSDDGNPNVVPVAFKNVTEDGKLVVGDVFMETTMNNVKANGKVAISAYDAKTYEGYQVKGTAEYVTEGPVVDMFKGLVEKTFRGAATAKGALVITPEQVIVTTPGADNKKVL
jgi:predicted pyridoxine 5'-phosphate oxidase superfamily flavin-nucleotide-binding protein